MSSFARRQIETPANGDAPRTPTRSMRDEVRTCPTESPPASAAAVDPHVRTSRSPRTAALLPWALGAFGVLYTFSATLLSRFRLVPGDDTDGRFVLYLLEHSYLWLRQASGHARLWEAPYFFPAPNVVAYSELMLGVAPPYWMLRLAGVEPYVAYSAWLIALSVANYAVTFVVLRRLLPASAECAALGAFVFAFANPRIAQIGHPQLIAQFLPLIALVALVRAVEAHSRARPRTVVGGWLSLATLAEVVQLHASYYHAWFLAYALVVCLALALGSRPYRTFLLSFGRANVVPIAACALLGLALSAPLVLHYLGASRVAGLRSFSEMLTYAPRAWSWTFMGPDNTLYGWLLGTRHRPLTLEEGEQQLGIGLVTTVLALRGLWVERGRPLFDLLLGLTIVTVLVATMWLPPLTLWIPVFAVLPGARAIRAVSRIALLLLVPLAIGVAAGAARLEARRRLWALVCALVVAEQLRHVATYDARETERRELALVARIPAGCEAFFALRPDSASSSMRWQIDAMWASLRSGVPTVNGYSGFVPRGLRPLWSETAESPAAGDSVPALVRRWTVGQGRAGVEVCVIPPG